MKDHHFSLLALMAIAGAIGWYYLSGSHASNDAAQVAADAPLPVEWDTPMDDVYAANPSAYQPATPASLTLNIPNQALSLLSDQYTPLFGFVGVAQGEMYQ